MSGSCYGHYGAIVFRSGINYDMIDLYTISRMLFRKDIYAYGGKTP